MAKNVKKFKRFCVFLRLLKTTFILKKGRSGAKPNRGAGNGRSGVSRSGGRETPTATADGGDSEPHAETKEEETPQATASGGDDAPRQPRRVGEGRKSDEPKQGGRADTSPTPKHPREGLSPLTTKVRLI